MILVFYFHPAHGSFYTLLREYRATAPPNADNRCPPEPTPSSTRGLLAGHPPDSHEYQQRSPTIRRPRGRRPTTRPRPVSGLQTHRRRGREPRGSPNRPARGDGESALELRSAVSALPRRRSHRRRPRWRVRTTPPTGTTAASRSSTST